MCGGGRGETHILPRGAVHPPALPLTAPDSAAPPAPPNTHTNTHTHAHAHTHTTHTTCTHARMHTHRQARTRTHYTTHAHTHTTHTTHTHTTHTTHTHTHSHSHSHTHTHTHTHHHHHHPCVQQHRVVRSVAAQNSPAPPRTHPHTRVCRSAAWPALPLPVQLLTPRSCAHPSAASSATSTWARLRSSTTSGGPTCRSGGGGCRGVLVCVWGGD